VVKWTSVSLGYGPNKAFLVPDSCRATERNGNSISSDVADDTNEADFRTMLVVAIFRQFGRCFGLFVFQDIHNRCTLSLNIKLICTSYETDYF
jgi:hypothetical protein